MSDNSFEKLCNLMVGKTVIRIETPNAPEAICKFILNDGTAFRLHATDLGFWVEETVVEGGYYPSFHDLVVDYDRHINYDAQYDLDAPSPKMLLEGDIVSFVSPLEKRFSIKMSSLSETERNIIQHSQAKKVLLGAFALGPYWRTYFLPKNAENLPPSCHIKIE